MKYLPDELKEGFSEMILINSEESDNESLEKISTEINLIQKEIKILGLKEEQKGLAEKIKFYERAKQKLKLKETKIKFNKILKERLKLEGDKGV